MPGSSSSSGTDQDVHVRLTDHKILAMKISPESARSRQWTFDKYGIQRAWKSYGTKGAGARVAVLDTGCLTSHLDLRRAVKAQHDYTRSGGSMDSVGHGTHVCGVICGEGRGVRGVAPEAEVHSFKIFDSKGRCNPAHVYRALQDIDSEKFGRFDVVNMSIGMKVSLENIRLLLLKLAAKGVLLVCAAGNNSNHDKTGAPRFGTVMYPAHFNSTIAVGSLNASDVRSNFSSSGPKMTLMGPGEDIVSTYKDDAYCAMSGTSMASPFIAGCLALLVSWCRKTGAPMPSHDAVLYALAKSCEDAENPGFDFYTGYGIVNMDRLLAEYRAFVRQ